MFIDGTDSEKKVSAAIQTRKKADSPLRMPADQDEETSWMKRLAGDWLEAL